MRWYGSSIGPFIGQELVQRISKDRFGFVGSCLSLSGSPACACAGCQMSAYVKSPEVASMRQLKLGMTCHDVSRPQSHEMTQSPELTQSPGRGWVHQVGLQLLSADLWACRGGGDAAQGSTRDATVGCLPGVPVPLNPTGAVALPAGLVLRAGRTMAGGGLVATRRLPRLCLRGVWGLLSKMTRLSYFCETLTARHCFSCLHVHE